MSESKIFIDGERPRVYRIRADGMTYPWFIKCPCYGGRWAARTWRDAFDLTVDHVREAHL